ncbi:M23 family metallopeptidase [Arthrobacter sp. Leaf141]|uniref:M23 family metallopeptidase n=1 Tax=Arthrobacter sp. Leaf141 TaxID=1736273 RepID=UPI0009E66BCE|nr:M23 family metallopeptidase [Arthrobacter sp. Leaf141]
MRWITIGVDLLGKHWGAGNGQERRRSFRAASRAAAGSAVLAAVVCVVSQSGAPAGGTNLRDAAALSRGSVDPAASFNGAATGAFGSPGSGAATGDSGQPASGTVGAGALAQVIFSDPTAAVPFTRSPITGQSTAGILPSAIGTSGVGRPPAGFLMAPLAALSPSSPFGFRVSPLTGGGGDFHLGQDYAAACGTPVYAADRGVVRAAGWHPWGGGNRVEIDHGNGLVTTYNHLQSISVRAGDPVRMGQAIAHVGSTGWSTGCHLHFETIVNGKYVNPQTWGLVPLSAVTGGDSTPAQSYLPGSGPATGGSIIWTIPGGQAAAIPSTSEEPGDEDVTGPSGSTSPSPIVIPTPSPSPSPTVTPSPSPSPSPTVTPSPSPSPRPTPTVTPSPSPSPTPTPTKPSPTPTPTPTTPSPSPTATPAPSATSTSSPTPSSTATPTPTPIPTTTPTPTKAAVPATLPAPTPPATATATTTPTTTPPAALKQAVTPSSAPARSETEPAATPGPTLTPTLRPTLG